MTGQSDAHDVGMSLPHLGTAFNVSEQERYRSRWRTSMRHLMILHGLPEQCDEEFRLMCDESAHKPENDCVLLFFNLAARSYGRTRTVGILQC